MHTDPANSGSVARLADQIGLPHSFIDRLPIGVAVVDLQGQFSILNRTATELFGLPEVVRSLQEAHASRDVYLPEDTKPASLEQNPLSRVLAGEGAVSGILRVESGEDGTERRIFAECMPLFDERGELCGAAATYSEFGRAEGNGPTAALHSISRDLAHELNQPLTTISLYARGCIRRLEHEGSEQAEMLEALEAIHDQALQAGEMIRHAREFSPWGPLQLESRSLNSLLLELEDAAQTRAAGAGCQIEIQLDPALPLCDFDSSRIGHLIWRFTDMGVEGIRTAEATPTLHWRTRNVPDGVELRISESSTGARGSADAPFDESKAKRALCLTICRRIAEEHGGRIELDRDPAGSHVSLILPVSSEVQEDDETVE